MYMKLTPLVLAAILVGCGSDSGDDNTTSPTNATLNFSVINQLDNELNSFDVNSYALDNHANHANHDKDLSDLDKVNIAFNYVFLKKVASLPGEVETCDQTGQCEQYHNYFDDQQNELRMIEVKAANGSDASPLFDGMMVKPGYYQMCLYINGESKSGGQVETDVDSHVIEHNGNADFLSSPSQGSCAGAKPPKDARPSGRLVSQTFQVQRGENNLAFKFDLESTLKYNNKHGWRFLGQKDFEIVQIDSNFGQIIGSVDIESIQQECKMQDDSALEAVYLYPYNTQQQQMLGYHSHSVGVEGEQRPLNHSMVSTTFAEGIDDQVAYFGFNNVKAGTYALGYSCSAQNDNEDNQGAYFNIYSTLDSVLVKKGQVTYPEFVAN
ncbi:hypothetical protein KP803_05585 [Vibrio sp. ZSDE26]|uniref:DUF4382 domain-containing protein n=1 Tax=Vibrio amylolyticus TaxID=2847292 RepID=A0A9X2BGE1_9VIBR|nr:hypothetical protein [Vibrio amylolyticus]MCK6262744.1 hypothetical protein [Vibrio amylolyticus]